ncbi:hypothetical protein MMC22_001432 [Lobaria immixta]|nr:hypothetical protein [Lobaria immixta]
MKTDTDEMRIGQSILGILEVGILVVGIPINRAWIAQDPALGKYTRRDEDGFGVPSRGSRDISGVRGPVPANWVENAWGVLLHDIHPVQLQHSQPFNIAHRWYWNATKVSYQLLSSWTHLRCLKGSSVLAFIQNNSEPRVELSRTKVSDCGSTERWFRSSERSSTIVDILQDWIIADV